MNRDAGSYQLSHTRDQVISRSRHASSCINSQQDVIKMSDGHRNVVNDTQLCKVRSFVVALTVRHMMTIFIHRWYVSNF